MSKILCGIDPGMDGGIAIIWPSGSVDLHKMPVFETITTTPKGKSRKERHIDADELSRIIKSITGEHGYTVEVYVERITHLYGLPSTSNFKLGYAAGCIHAIVQMYVGEFYTIGPKKWQQIWENEDIEHETNKNGSIKLVQRGKSRVKKVNSKVTSLNAARRLYPDHDLLHKGGRVPHNGCIDALLIATYGGEQ